MALQKTIVLTALPNCLSLDSKNMEGITSVIKSPASKVSILIDSKRKDVYSSDGISPAPVRKRQRLDHLSHDEKIQRRKLKNRVAAQCARDRKKEKMTKLEDEIEELKAEKQMLLQENFVLQQQNLQLEEENSELKKRLQDQTTDSKESSTQVEKVFVKQEKDSCCTLEHAAETGSSTLFSLDDALSLFANDCEPDKLLAMFEQCSNELSEDSISSNTGNEGITESNSKERSSDQVVGSTSEELESFKELIDLDHIYYKHKDVSLSNQQIISTENEKEEPVILSEKLVHEREQFNPEHSPKDCQSFSIPILIKEECEDLPEPVSPLSSVTSFFSRTSSPCSGDSGYDSIGSPLIASSPFSDHCDLMDDPWNETFTELFPSLV